MGLHNVLPRGVAVSCLRVLSSRFASILSIAAGPILCGMSTADPQRDQQPADQQPQSRCVWRLSVIDGGQPRGEALPQATTDSSAGQGGDGFAESQRLDAAEWKFLDGIPDRYKNRQPSLGRRGAVPIAGDFNGDGQAEIGVFIDGQWFIDLNGNGRWDDADLWAKLGRAGDQPVVGDWDGDGKTDIGVWGSAAEGDLARAAAETGLPDADNESPNKSAPAANDATSNMRGPRLLKRTSQGEVRADAVDHVFEFGLPNGIAVAGDFNGDGIDTVGVFRHGRWLLDAHGDGKSSADDTEFVYGADGDVPVVGDFNGDGIDEIGIFRDGTWHIDTNGNHVLDEGDAELKLGGERDAPVVGDFDGDGSDQIGVYRGDEH